jgi:ABC-type transporter Mla MlaB component
MNDLDLHIIQDGKWLFAGELSMRSLSKSWKEVYRKRPSTSPWAIDFSSIDKMDSAGVAFLLECIGYAKQHNISLSFVDLSNDALNLIKAQGMDSIIKPYIRGRHAS